jgi:hypothetical protein
MKNHPPRLASPSTDFQSPLGGAPSSSPSSFEARGGVSVQAADANGNSAVKIDDAIAKLAMTEGGCKVVPTESDSTSPSSKENVRPNSGRKKSWKKKSHRHNREAPSSSLSALASNTFASIPAESQIPNCDSDIVRPLLLKNKKAVVVEISPQDTISILAVPRQILPSMDYNVAVDVVSSPSSTNDDAIAAEAAGGSGNRNRSKTSRSNQRKSKKNQQRNKQYSMNEGPTNIVIASVAAPAPPPPPAVDDGNFTTNTEGDNVLALLGQYSYASPTSNEGSCVGYHPHFSEVQTMMMTGGDNNYEQYQHHHHHHGQYNSSNYTATDANIPTTSYNGHLGAYDIHCPYDATSSAVPLGYCFPVSINGAVYYQQFGRAESMPYYYYYNNNYSGYSHYEMSTHQQQPSSPPYYSNNYYTDQHPQPNECTGDSGQMALNIQAPAYNPNENLFEEA